MALKLVRHVGEGYYLYPDNGRHSLWISEDELRDLVRQANDALALRSVNPDSIGAGYPEEWIGD